MVGRIHAASMIIKTTKKPVQETIADMRGKRDIRPLQTDESTVEEIKTNLPDTLIVDTTLQRPRQDTQLATPPTTEILPLVTTAYFYSCTECGSSGNIGG